MAINEKLSILDKEWHQNHPGHFLADGVIDENKYQNSDVKVLFSI